MPVVGTEGGRAHQAAREHVPAREHRARQRAGDVRRTTSASTCGRRSTPRRPSRSATCASRPGPGVGGHCLPIDPSLPVVAGEAAPRPVVPVRRAGQRRQRAHARLRRAPARRSRSTSAGMRCRGVASCCSASRTRRTPATPARHRQPSIARLLVELGADVCAADPHVGRDAAAGRRRARRRRRRRARARRRGGAPRRPRRLRPGRGCRSSFVLDCRHSARADRTCELL